MTNCPRGNPSQVLCPDLGLSWSCLYTDMSPQRAKKDLPSWINVCIFNHKVGSFVTDRFISKILDSWKYDNDEKMQVKEALHSAWITSPELYRALYEWLPLRVKTIIEK